MSAPAFLCLRRLYRVGYCGLWDEGLSLSSHLWDPATTLGVLKRFLSKEGGCPMNEEISSAPSGETERASCEVVPPEPFSPLRQAAQLATSNILQSKHVAIFEHVLT